MIRDDWSCEWQQQERRFEPAIILTLTLGMTIATFLTFVN